MPCTGSWSITFSATLTLQQPSPQPAVVIEELCKQAIARYKHLPERFVDAEQRRLTRLVTDWLKLKPNEHPSGSRKPNSDIRWNLATYLSVYALTA